MGNFKAGDKVLLAPKNPHDLDRHDYVETTVLWTDEVFILCGEKGFWPTLSKIEHVSIKPLKTE